MQPGSLVGILADRDGSLSVVVGVVSGRSLVRGRTGGFACGAALACLLVLGDAGTMAKAIELNPEGRKPILVLPDDPSPLTRRAAEVLARGLRDLAGQEPTVEEGPSRQPPAGAIVLAGGESAKDGFSADHASNS